MLPYIRYQIDRHLAQDAENSLPDIVIKMMANKRIVAYARIAPKDVGFTL